MKEMQHCDFHASAPYPARRGSRYGAGVGDMSDGHLQAAAVVRDLVEVPFLDPPRRRPIAPGLVLRRARVEYPFEQGSRLCSAEPPGNDFMLPLQGVTSYIIQPLWLCSLCRRQACSPAGRDQRQEGQQREKAETRKSFSVGTRPEMPSMTMGTPVRLITTLAMEAR